jgi:hypothetical protein
MKISNLFIAGLTACIVPAAGSTSANAEPPQSVYYNKETPFVVCDTREQINEVLQAMKANKLKDKLVELSKVLDSNKEPVCLYSVIGPVIFDQSEHVGLIFDQQGGIDMWLSQVHNAQMKFFLLWGEVGDATSA